jgi:hypothetical protein
MFWRDFPELEVPLDLLPLLEVPTDMFWRDFPDLEVPTDFLEPAEWEVPTELDMFMRDFPDLEVPTDFFEPADWEVPTELDMFMRELESEEVPADFLEPPELEVPADMFSRDLPETEEAEADLTEAFFPKRVSQKESFWRDFLDGELDLSVSLSTELSSSRLRRITFLPELDLDFL